MLRKILRISSISILLSACAGSPPKLEHAVKLYTGVPEKKAVCRNSQAHVASFIRRIAQNQMTKNYAAAAVKEILAEDGAECISAASPVFKTIMALSIEDLRVLLQYQENLLYSCERWRQ